MSYEEMSQAVRLEGPDRDLAQDHLASAAKELAELSGLVSRALDRAGDGRFTRVVIEVSAADEPVDVTVATFCHGTECLYVYDALKGVCRPCTPDDHACDPVSH